VTSTSGIAWLTQHNQSQANAAAQVERPGIIVSPFQNLGTIPELDYVAQAITAALTVQIAQIDAIELIADEAFAASGWTNPSATRSGNRASRDVFLVKGTVLSSRNRIRVGISLIDARSGTIARTATVERSTEGVFPLIGGLAKDLGELLRSELGHEIRVRRWRAATTNMRAWELQQRAEVERLRAKTFEENGSFSAAMAKLKEADSLLVIAQAEQPTWDAPIVWRARIAQDAAWLSFVPPINDTAQASHWLRMGLAHVDQVLGRDSAHALALELRGTLRYWSSLIVPHSDVTAAADLRRAEADLRRAVSIDRTRARAWNLLSALQFSRGDFAASYIAGQHAYSADAYLEAHEETFVRLALAAHEIGSDSTAWRWCTAIDAQTPQGAYCRLSLLAWSDIPANVAPPEPWVIIGQLSDSTPIAQSMRAPLMMLVADVLARRELADSARAVIERVRQGYPRNHELDLLEAGARLTLGEVNTAVALLRRYVMADPAHNAGVIASRRFGDLRSHVPDLVVRLRQLQ
jgi:TolB-like protein